MSTIKQSLDQAKSRNHNLVTFISSSSSPYRHETEATALLSAHSVCQQGYTLSHPQNCFILAEAADARLVAFPYLPDTHSSAVDAPEAYMP